MAKWVDLPASSRHAALAELLLQEAQAECVRVDQADVSRYRLIRHSPRAHCELQAACICLI